MKLNILKNEYISSIKPLEPNKFHSFITVSSALRANFSAGWNDTPPYCNENSGYTLNIPILYKNSFPVNVKIEKINTPKIILSNSYSEIEITNMLELINCQSPNSPFALHKSAILASGLIPFNLNFNLQHFFKKNSGFKLSTNVINIPVGSRSWY